MTDIPLIAVVGSVNKGKSSLVSTLGEIDSILVDHRPGSTTECEGFDFKIEAGGASILRLYDTPGFQNARRAAQWMKDFAGDEKSETEAVKAFLETYRGTAEFEDEWRLLEPLVEEGAGILYVVDGSSPFNPASLAEMEILRMTGRPRMAVINQTRPDRDFIEDLREKLSPYFKVTVFNTHRAGFRERLDLLESFQGIDDRWRDRIRRVIQALRQELEQRREEVARAIAALLIDLLSCEVVHTTRDRARVPELREKAEADFAAAAAALERHCRNIIRQCYRHHRVEIRDATSPDLDLDLSEQRAWQVFGLRPAQLVKVGVAAGAAAGAGIDVATGGHSLLLGTAIGAITGGGLTWLSSRKLAQVKIEKVLRVGRTWWEVKASPSGNPQLPFVMLDRALTWYRDIASLAHARREALDFETRSITAEFPDEVTRDFARLFREVLKRHHPVPEDVRKALRERIQSVL